MFKNYNTQTCGLVITKCKIDNLLFILLMEYYIYIFVSNLVQLFVVFKFFIVYSSVSCYYMFETFE